MRAFSYLLAFFASVNLLWAQPHVIFVTIDDLNRDSLGVHGCPVEDISPNLDALARSGLRFEHAHVAAANCTPSRAVMMSGMFSHNNGVLSVSNEGAGNHAFFTTMPDVFDAAGYHTGIMGKNGHQQPYEPYAGWHKEYDGYGSTRDPENVYDKISAAFVDAAYAEKPLFFNLNIYDPHVGWYQWDHKNGVPKSGNEVEPSIVYSAEDVVYPTFMPPLTPAEMDFGNGYGVMDEIAAYYNVVKRADDSIGRMMDAIRDAGAEEDTLIIVISDHGAELPGAKTMLWHHSSVSPLFVVWPGVTSPNTVDDTHMINSVDFLPSFCELVGQPTPANVDGRSFLPLIRAENPADWPDQIYKQHSVAHVSRAVQTTNLLYVFNPWSDGARRPSTVTDGHKCFEAIENAAEGGNAFAANWLQHFNHRTVEELYDVANDPDCFHNLATNAAFADDLNAMRERMKNTMRLTSDFAMLEAFTNRADATALDAYVDADQAMRDAMRDSEQHTRDVFFDPRDDWRVIGETIFEPAGTWDIWAPDGPGVNLNGQNGAKKDAGVNCVEFNGSVADQSRLIVAEAIDTSALDQLKLDVIFLDGGAFSAGAAVAFEYNDGSGWKTFETIRSAGKKNLIFERPEGGLPEAMFFAVRADLNGSGGSIYMDHARLTGWSDWATAPNDAPFDASDAGVVRLDFSFVAQGDFHLEAFDGTEWIHLESYTYDHALRPDVTHADRVELEWDAFPADLAFRFRAENPADVVEISDLTIRTREALRNVTVAFPPAATADAFEATAPKAIVVEAPGVLANDAPGNGGAPRAKALSNAAHGILEFNADGSFVYAATNGFTGTDGFSYAAWNESGASTTTVSLAVNEPLSTSTNRLRVEFGAEEDLFARLGETDHTTSTSQNEDIGAPTIRIESLNLDGVGGNDDRIDLVFSVTSEGGDLARLGSGYRLDDGYALTIELISAEITLGNGATNASISPIGFTSVTGNNSARTYSINSAETGFTPLINVKGPQRLDLNENIDGVSTFTATSTDTENNRLRGVVAEFEITTDSAGKAIMSFADWAEVHEVPMNERHLLDYAFNTNPRLANRPPFAPGAHGGEPIWRFSAGEARLHVEFTRRTHAPDLEYIPQFTDTLGSNWVDVTEVESIETINDDLEWVHVLDVQDVSGSDQRFGRILIIHADLENPR